MFTNIEKQKKSTPGHSGPSPCVPPVTHYLTWTASPGVAAGPFLTLPDWQSWFCQCLGIAPPAMAPYVDQICPCHRQRLDTDRLHTCSMNSGNWYCAHLVLSAVADIAHAAGFRTNRGSRVPNSRGQRRGDLEIKGLNVAGTTDLTAFEVLRTMNTPCHLTGGPAVPDQLPTGISISMIVGMHKLRF